MRKTIAACLCLAAILTGCKLQKTPAAFSIPDGEWSIIELMGEKLLPEATKQFLIFDAASRRLSGDAGCNRISGNIEPGGGRGKNGIKFQGIVSTRKACLDMRLEDELLRALDDAVRFDSEGRDGQAKIIVFYGTDNQRLFVISQTHLPEHF
ncbi:MAG: META domain-containing protein [Tannerellaceae bacterium]|jgi:heat shock protein HslJ|nr:META domain-containing protein [Tannerellaceae bacterium]